MFTSDFCGYHACPLCKGFTDEGGQFDDICSDCYRKYTELSSRKNLSDDEKVFVKRCYEIKKHCESALDEMLKMLEECGGI